MANFRVQMQQQPECQFFSNNKLSPLPNWRTQVYILRDEINANFLKNAVPTLVGTAFFKKLKKILLQVKIHNSKQYETFPCYHAA